MPAFEFVLASRYKLVAPLGEGGMAAVYRGRDLRLNREVAVKVLHDDLNRDPEFLQRFEREAQFVASLSHPNIVPVYDVGEEQGTHFIVMEYVRGRTLKDIIERDGVIPETRAVDILRAVLEALAYAHSQDLIHRDVKPQNILLTPDGTPRLADFGIARLVDGSTSRTAAILGSAQYLSPEQSRGEEASVRSDVYAAGIVLYEMLAGRPPFNGSNALAVANLHLSSEPPPLASLDVHVSPPLARALERALAKDPAQRFADAAEFSAALGGSPATIGDTQVAPLSVDGTSVQPLSLPAAQPEKAPSRPISAAQHRSEVVIRRSTRKLSMAAIPVVAGLVFLAWLANMGVAGYHLPAYPSAPYLAIPLVLVLAGAVAWFSTRSWVYTMDADAAVVQRGLLGHHRFGVPLKQVATLELRQSVIDRIAGVGTVELYARDAHGEERRLIMEDLPQPRQTYQDLVRMLGRAHHGHSTQ